MCGIAGFYSRGLPLSSSLLEEMTTVQRHRGPDAQGFLGVAPGGSSRFWRASGEYEGILRLGFGHRRLSILDLTDTGLQPMRSHCGRYWITYNGEIYNYVELRKELESSSFRGVSDTEVLLELFARKGTKALEELNGIFAFALYDSQEHELFLVRDPMGVKPLYYFQDERGLFFASEIRALLKARMQTPSLRLTLLSRYLTSSWVAAPETLFEGIEKLEPGHWLKVNRSFELQKHKYWDLDFQPDEEKELAEWQETVDSALNSAVDRQLRSDVPVAFFLSGGIDSSLLLAKASQARKQRPTTFTIGFRWSEEDRLDLDVRSARLMRDKFPIQYREIMVQPSLLSVLPKVIESLEEPIADAAAVCSYLICEAASKEFKVLVSGQGGG